MSANQDILVFAEQKNGCISEVSFELVCEAIRLSKTLGGTVGAIAIGSGMKDELPKLGHYGCNKVYYTEDVRLAHFSSVPYAKAITEIIRKRKPRIVLFGATSIGRDVAPRVASDLQCGLTADCTELHIGDYKGDSGENDKIYRNVLFQIGPGFGGAVIATIVSPHSSPSMATVREGVMKLALPDESRNIEVIREPTQFSEHDFMTQILEVVEHDKKVNLKSARIVVAAGMGAASTEGIELVKELARVLGGVVGCTRPVADAGLLPRETQIGQTGVTVRPSLYIACGISGHMQHCVGMTESKRIIAINTDPTAQIFDIAHYGIVGDLANVIPKMINAYRAR